MHDINLLPQEVFEEKAKRRKTFLRMMIIIIIIIVMALAYLTLYYLDYKNRIEINKVNEEITALNDVKIKQIQLENIQKEISFKKNQNQILIDSEINYYRLLNEIEKTIPQSISFLIESGTDNSIYISGEAGIIYEKEIADFAVNLSKINGVKNVWIDSAVFETNVVFQISFQYRGEKVE